MKKLILAGIVIIIGCLIFIIIQQNSSQADISVDMFKKPYPVPFGDWVVVYFSTYFDAVNTSCNERRVLKISEEVIEDNIRFTVYVIYPDTEVGKQWYQKSFSQMKEFIRGKCRNWTIEGYPISLNDFQFDIGTY